VLQYGETLGFLAKQQLLRPLIVTRSKGMLDQRDRVFKKMKTSVTLRRAPQTRTPARHKPDAS